jgi:tRNA threonylcarbamoyl adenosine modification protein YeaZ
MFRLALDTSSAKTSIAFERSDLSVVSTEVVSPSSHSEALASQLESTAKEAGLSDYSQISEIVVGLGPGSFTGLRIGLSLAKGIALAHQIPIRGESSYRAMAMSQSHMTGVIGVIGDARRQELFYGTYHYENGGEVKVTDPSIVSLEQFRTEWRSCASSGALLLLDAGLELTGESANLKDEFEMRSVGKIAEGLLSLTRARRGSELSTAAKSREWSIEDLTLLEPHYVRGVSALTLEQQNRAPLGTAAMQGKT